MGDDDLNEKTKPLAEADRPTSSEKELFVRPKTESSISPEIGSENRLGQVLLRRGQIRRYQLVFALQLQDAYRALGRRVPLGELLVTHRALSEPILKEALSAQIVLPQESVTKVIKDWEDHGGPAPKIFEHEDSTTKKHIHSGGAD